MTKTVFVTGGADYGGSHVCKRFAANGWLARYSDNDMILKMARGKFQRENENTA